MNESLSPTRLKNNDSFENISHSFIGTGDNNNEKDINHYKSEEEEINLKQFVYYKPSFY